MTIRHHSVIAGLGPAIHSAPPQLVVGSMDARVKPGHDVVGYLNQFLNFLNRFPQRRVEASETTLVFAVGACR